MSIIYFPTKIISGLNRDLLSGSPNVAVKTISKSPTNVYEIGIAFFVPSASTSVELGISGISSRKLPAGSQEIFLSTLNIGITYEGGDSSQYDLYDFHKLYDTGSKPIDIEMIYVELQNQQQNEDGPETPRGTFTIVQPT